MSGDSGDRFVHERRLVLVGAETDNKHRKL